MEIAAEVGVAPGYSPARLKLEASRFETLPGLSPAPQDE
jgi:hypothetical protein